MNYTLLPPSVSKMAMQLKTIANKMLSLTVNLMRNYSRSSVPSIFFGNPFRRHRQLFSNSWNAPFDQTHKMQKLMNSFRMPSMNVWQGETFVCNPKDGFHVLINVNHFTPKEINVRVIDKLILVEAKHEERAETGESYASRQFARQFVLPDELSVKDIMSTLSSDGILSIRVPPKGNDPPNAHSVRIHQIGAPARHPGENGAGDKINGSGDKINP